MSTLALCNQALAENASPSIAAFNEPSVEAREVSRVRLQVMDELLDWTEWEWTERRVALALIANDRPGEWLFAYAKPNDCGTPIAIRSPGSAATSLPIGGPFTLPPQDAIPLRFELADSKIYTNVEQATLVYHRTGDFHLPPLVARAYVLELAARISYPLKKDMKLRDGLVRLAAYARAAAIADERNKEQRPAPRYVSEVEFARAGYSERF